MRAVVQELFAKLGPDGASLRRVVGALSVLRLPFGAAELEAFGAGTLEPRSAAILERALLFGEANGLSLHEVIAREANRWLELSRRVRSTHEQAADLHRARFAQASGARNVASSIREELEVVHHRTSAGDAKLLLEDSIWFADQFVDLGRTLSRQERHREAVQAYERAVEHDPDDAYAHHYLAWNLDVDAREPARVERHYRKAVERASEHPWYQGRLVSFLITRGRAREARLGWDAALAEVLRAHGSEDERVYEELHGQVARLLLHRGELEFARDVLEDIPEHIAGDAAWARALRRLLEGLFEARDQRLVFPPSLPAAERWRPRLFDSSELAGATWMPGRIDNHDTDQVHIRVARRAADTVEYAWLDLSHPAFHTAVGAVRPLPPAGTFVELVERPERLVLRRQAAELYSDDALPRLFPRPDRYVGARVAP